MDFEKRVKLAHEQMHEQMHEWDKQLIRQINAAEGPSVVKVAAHRTTQAGLKILVARCPNCRTAAALAADLVKPDQPARHFCRGCNTLLEYVPDDIPLPEVSRQ